MPPEPLTLASRSPQRRAILTQLGIDFRVVVPDVEETTQGAADQLVLENARRKARAVSGGLVLGVDTAVVLEGRVFGKPSDAAQAEEFLRSLSGRSHEVLSGVVLVQHGAELTRVATTRVRFRRLEPADLDWYLASGEWHERAGGYAIQARGAALVEQVEGDYSNVVGLPVSALVAMAPYLLRG